MKRMNKMPSALGGFSSGASLGGKISHYRDKQNIYTQVRLLTHFSTSKKQECGSPLARSINHQQLPRFWE